MSTVSIHSIKPTGKTLGPRQRHTEPAAAKAHSLPVSSGDDLPMLIAKRAYELYIERGGRE